MRHNRMPCGAALLDASTHGTCGSSLGTATHEPFCLADAVADAIADDNIPSELNRTPLDAIAEDHIASELGRAPLDADRHDRAYDDKAPRNGHECKEPAEVARLPQL